MRTKSLSVIVFSVFAMHFVGVPARADTKLTEPTEEQLTAAKKAYARFGGELIPYKHPVSSVIYAQFNFDKKKATLNDEDIKNLPDLPIAFMLDFESCAKVTDAGLKHLTKLKNLYGLGLRGTQTTDLGLRELKAHTNLTDLVLGQTKITDDGLKELKGLKNLTILWLHDTSVTDAGVKELKDLKNLTVLSLGDTKVTDAGLKEIKNLTNLKSLELVGTQVTDAGLKELIGLKNLLELNLSKTRVTHKGVQELQRVLPKCEITATTGEALSIPKPEPIRHRLNDCHLHLVDFLQRTDGIKALVAAMDRSGVDDVVISGMPVVKLWSQHERRRPDYYLDDDARCYWYSATDVLVAREVLSLQLGQQKRFHPIICGFNSADRNAIDHIKRMIDWYPDFWQGIGEVMTRHDELTALTYGDVPRADNFALSRVFKFAGEHDLPVWIHTNIGSVSKKEPHYLLEMESAVRAHPKTRFIWCHAGISRRIEIPTLTRHLTRMLDKYPNLYADVSWVVFEQNLLKDGKPDPSWIKLVESFPTRFMIGSDKVGRFANYHQEMQKYYKFLDELKPSTAEKLAKLNMLSVLPKERARLTKEEIDSLNRMELNEREPVRSKTKAMEPVGTKN